VDGGGNLTHSFNNLLVFAAADIAVGVNYSDSGTPSPWAQGGIMGFLIGADVPLAVRPSSHRLGVSVRFDRDFREYKEGRCVLRAKCQLVNKHSLRENFDV
jgi:hypothetical protein